MTQYYVSLIGNNLNNGLTESTAWRTITYSATKAQAGDTVNIEGGNYGEEYVIIENSGNVNNPIIFQGYDGTPIITGNNIEYGISAIGSNLVPKQYITLNNIKVTNYSNGIYFKYANHITVDKCIVDNIGVGALSGYGILYEHTDNSVIRNCTLTDGGSMVGIYIIESHNNIVDNCKVYQITTLQDYAMVIAYGHDNTIQNCLAQNNCGSIIWHGIGIKDYPWAVPPYYLSPFSYNNKITDCIANGYGEGFFIAHHAYNNEISNCYTDRINIPTEGHWMSGICIRDSAHDNIIKKCIVIGYVYGINLELTGEDVSPLPKGTNYNKFYNIIVKDCYVGIMLRDSNYNKFYNLTMNNMSNFMLRTFTESNNLVTNSILSNIPILYYTWDTVGTVSLTYCNFWNNGFVTPSGIGNISLNPLFADITNNDYHLKSQYARWNGITWVQDTVTSPSIGAGDPTSNNSLSPWNGRIEMGTYGNTPESSSGVCPIPICDISLIQL